MKNYSLTHTNTIKKLFTFNKWRHNILYNHLVNIDVSNNEGLYFNNVDNTLKHIFYK